jgi:hypothetical protein
MDRSITLTAQKPIPAARVRQAVVFSSSFETPLIAPTSEASSQWFGVGMAGRAIGFV